MDAIDNTEVGRRWDGLKLGHLRIGWLRTQSHRSPVDFFDRPWMRLADDEKEQVASMADNVSQPGFNHKEAVHIRKFSGNKEDALNKVVKILGTNGVGTLVVGAIAVQEHGYARNTEDIDLSVSNARQARYILIQNGYKILNPIAVSDPENNVKIDIIQGGWKIKGTDVPNPIPQEINTEPKVCDLPTLLDLKIGSFMGSYKGAEIKLQVRGQDIVDVKTLVINNNLPRNFMKGKVHQTEYEKIWDGLHEPPQKVSRQRALELLAGAEEDELFAFHQSNREKKMAKDNKVEFVLKGKKREASFSSPETAEAFIKAAAEKWGPDFSAPGSVAVTSDKSYIDGEKPEGLKTADTDKLEEWAMRPEGEGGALDDVKEHLPEDMGFTGRLVTLSTDGYGRLQVSATDEGQRLAASLANEATVDALHHLLAEATENGWRWEAPEDLGALTDAPIISDPDGNVYWHQNYQVEDPVETLARGGTVQFDSGGTKEREMGPTEGGVVASKKDVRKDGKAGKEAGFNFFFPGQALREFYPDLQHELVDSPNATNAPMVDSGVDVAKGTNESTIGGIVGDPHEDPELDIAIEASFDGMKKLGYVSTSPGAVGLGRDFKPQVLEGKPFRTEDEIRGPMFQEEFYQNFDMGPEGGAMNVVAKQAAAFGGEKEQFGAFLKKVMAEVAATFISAWKVTSRPPLDKVPGTGSLQLDQVEQRDFSGMSGLLMGQEGMGSRVKHLVDKLNDSEIQSCINDSWAQSAVWNSTLNGGFVYEVFVRAESLDSESLLLKYRFITGVRDSDIK